MSAAKTRQTILSIVQTDNTFQRASVRGELVWVGRCLHCKSALVVGLDGAASPEVTIEHILARNQGGGDEPANLALACAACNHEKGVRHDRRRQPDARAQEITTRLLAERQRRWRDGPG